MESQLKTMTKPASSGAPAAMFTRPVMLQRKCACGAPTSSLTGECSECGSKKRVQTKLTIGASNDPLEPALRQDDAEQRLGHDFSQVRVHSSAAAITSRGASDGVFIDGPDKGNTAKPAAPQPRPKPKTPSTKTTNCPTNVQVINIDPLSDSQFGKNGMLTGIGAVAYMEVSDSGGNDWDGTIVQETVKQTKNTCGARARKVCSNESGESGGFKVGEGTNLLGVTKMPALRNTFYDLHIFTQGVSILHELGKSECEIQCQQSYQCGGKQIGPEFVITYMTKKDTIAKTYDVTRIRVNKEAKATPANP